MNLASVIRSVLDPDDRDLREKARPFMDSLQINGNKITVPHEQLSVSTPSALSQTSVQSDYVKQIVERSKILPLCHIDEGIKGTFKYPTLESPTLITGTLEGENVSDVTPYQISSFTFQPHQLMAEVITDYSSTLQSDGLVHNIIRDLITYSMRSQLDQTIMGGDGLYRPKGIFSIDSIPSTNIGGGEIPDDVISEMSNVIHEQRQQKTPSDSYGGDINPVFIVDTELWGNIISKATTIKDSNLLRYNIMLYPVIITEETSYNLIVFGDLYTVYVGFWDTIDFIVNQESGTGNWNITAIQLYDIKFFQPEVNFQILDSRSSG